jgi:hypothetical protein
LGVWGRGAGETGLRLRASRQTGRQAASSAAACLRDMEGAGRRNFDSATLFPSLSTQERTACREQPERRASIGAGLEVQYAQPIVAGREGREKACATPSVWTLVSNDAAMRSPRWHGVVMSFTLCDMRQLLQSTCSSAGELLSWALGHGRSERPATTID